MVRAVACGVKGSEFNSQHGYGVFFFFLSLSWLIRKTQLSPLAGVPIAPVAQVYVAPVARVPVSIVARAPVTG